MHAPRMCPICHDTITKRCCILDCGHSYCMACLEMALTQSRAPTMKCATCRAVVRKDTIEFINTARISEAAAATANSSFSTPATAADGVQPVTVVGDHSAKITGCIRCLKGILAADSLDKTVVFSQWNEVLDLLAQACAENGITAVLAVDTAKFHKALQRFKTEAGTSVLLLPYSKGGQGLNIIEASHVILVEPVLDPRLELQSIGRVHRIGQTKETFVHKFVIQDTIEQAIVATTATSGRELTLGDLSRLLSSSSTPSSSLVTSSSDYALTSGGGGGHVASETRQPECILERRQVDAQVGAEVLVQWRGTGNMATWMPEAQLNREVLDCLLYADRFWAQPIRYRGRTVERQAALATLTTAAAFDQPAEFALWEKRSLLGRYVHVPLARLLLATEAIEVAQAADSSEYEPEMDGVLQRARASFAC